MLSLKTLATIGCAIAATGIASAQIAIGGSGNAIRVQGSIGIGNGESTLSLVNPNPQGSFVFLFPAMKPLEAGQALPLQLIAVGKENGQTVFVWKADSLSTDVTAGPSTQQTVPNAATSQFVTSNVEIPPMMSGTSQIVRIDIPGIKAGSAISVSPSDELPGMLAIAHASAPIDCVVIIKFINPGPFIPGLSLNMSFGAVSRVD